HPHILFYRTRSPPTSTLFPYTTLFRSRQRSAVSFCTLRAVGPVFPRLWSVHMSTFPITKRGAEKLKEELQRLKTVDRPWVIGARSEEHTSELQSRENLVCRLLLEKKK